MNLIRFNPLKQKNTLPGFFEDFFNRSLSDLVGSDFTSNVPSANIIEEDDHFSIELAAPGLSKKDFAVEIKHDNLIISVKKESKKEEVDEGFFTRKEFNYSSFTRSFQLAETVDQDNITANYVNGVLKIILVKKEEAKKPESRKISIK